MRRKGNSMEFYETVAARRSIRKYKQDAVPRETLTRILEAARLAPSWCNRQCHRYIVVSDSATRKMLGELVENPSAECYEKAPYALVLCAEPSDSGFSSGKEYYLVDCGVSMEHLVLAATAEGLGTCWVGNFRENPVRNLLGIPHEVKVVGITPLGVPDEAPEARPRTELDRIVFENAWRRDNI